MSFSQNEAVTLNCSGMHWLPKQHFQGEIAIKAPAVNLQEILHRRKKKKGVGKCHFKFCGHLIYPRKSQGSKFPTLDVAVFTAVYDQNEGGGSPRRNKCLGDERDQWMVK